MHNLYIQDVTLPDGMHALRHQYSKDQVKTIALALDKALRVGLGTDISGGHSAFLLDNARAAVTVSLSVAVSVPVLMVMPVPTASAATSVEPGRIWRSEV